MITDRTGSEQLFLVTGAAGKTGGQTVRLLRERDLPVRALVRGLDERAQRLHELGADVVEVDLLNYSEVRGAAEGVSAAYFNYPPGPGYVEAAANFADAAADNGVRAVVEMSQIGIRPDTTHIGQQHWVVERLFDRTPMITTHLRPTIFMNWLENFWIRSSPSEAVIRLPIGGVRFAPIATADSAKVVVAVLQDPATHDRQVYELFGAEELDWYQIADKVEATLGISVRYEPVEMADMTTALTAGGIPADRVHHLGKVVQDIRDGFYSGFNGLVEEIGGSEPTTVEQYVEIHRDLFGSDGVLAISDARLNC